MKNGNEKFKSAWAQIVDLIEDEEFGDDVCGPDYAAQCKQVAALITAWEVPNENAKVRDDIYDMVSSGAREFYFAEYAGNAPGSRSSHLEMYKRYKTVVKNRVRALFDMPQKGTNESAEVDTFLREQAQAVGGSFSQYSEDGTKISKAITERFGFKRSLADYLVGVCEDQYVSKKNSGWNTTLMEYVGILLAEKRRKNG